MALAPVTVWAVRLGASSVDVKGKLSLEPEELVFTMEDEALRIRLEDIRKAKRNRGSPILIVEHTQDGQLARHAFFFTKPPPMAPAKGRGKRRQARHSIIYLQRENGELKDVVKEWESALRS